MKPARWIVPVLFACAAATAVGGCSGTKDDQAKAPLTQAQRDSVLAASKIPGAGVVGKALATADSAEARAKRVNEAARPNR